MAKGPVGPSLAGGFGVAELAPGKLGSVATLAPGNLSPGVGGTGRQPLFYIYIYDIFYDKILNIYCMKNYTI